MPQLCQDDRERAMDMVQAGITHQAVADHFNVSKITIARLIIRLRQTCRTNDRPRNDGTRVTSQRQNRHLRLIHLRNCMITDEDTAHRTPALANIPISDPPVRRRLRECGLRARCPLVEPILKQRHRTYRETSLGSCTRRWRLLTFLVINPDFHFTLAMDVIVCTTGVGIFLRTNVCTSPTVLEAEVLWYGLEFFMMVALSSKLFKEH